LCGQQWSPSEVLLAHRQPRDARPYKEFFRAPIRFDADQSGLSFATYWLDLSVSGADPALHRHLAQEADDLKRQREDGFVGRLRRSIRLALANGECVAAEVAQGLGMHERTLNRRLRSEGTNFRREVAHVRYEAARQLLADTQLPVSRIAAALGYGDTTAFARAFKGWSGAAPATWRREHEQAE
ncbi:MAG: hypothetical protein RLZ44_1294, partial [Pseudomonadota bacterium]